MEPATYQIPLVVLPVRDYPWQRLYMTPTHSSAARARAVPHTYANSSNCKEMVKDSLEWTLKSMYDHENDLFIDKSTALRRPGIDKRRCQRDQARIISERNTSQVLRAEQKAEALAQGADGFAHIRTTRDSLTSPSGDSQRSSGPRVVTLRTRDSLMTSLLYSPRPTHTLTVPKVTPGYARNPSGAFFTS